MRGIKLADDDPRHGDYRTYRNVRIRCRCDRCRDSHRVRCAEEREDRFKRGLPDRDPRHGTHTGYQNWGCRCARCSKAESLYVRAGRRMAAGGKGAA